MFRSLGVALTLMAACLFAAPASAEPAPRFAGPGAWVQVAPNYPQKQARDDSAVQMLLYDVQSRLSPQGEETYVRRVRRVRNADGLSEVGSIDTFWDPATESLTIHTLAIIRDGRRIDMLNEGDPFLVLRRETRLELAMLDGRLTAARQIEGLRVGDIVDWAYTRQTVDPVRAGHPEAIDYVYHTGVAARVRFRYVWGVETPIRWRASLGVGQPVRAVLPTGGVELQFDRTDVSAATLAVDAPARFAVPAYLELSTFERWNGISAMLAPHYGKAAVLPDDPALKAEVERIKTTSAEPRARALAALRLVQDQTRYVFLGMDGGGYMPASASQTWRRRFGDCKGKTVLLVAVLQALGLPAEPALVHSREGDTLTDRIPTLGAFDHVIVRTEIDGVVYWLDGARVGDRDLSELTGAPYYWALPLRAEGAALEKLEALPRTTPQIQVGIRMDVSKGIDAPSPTQITYLFRGDAGVAYRQSLSGQSSQATEQYLRKFAAEYHNRFSFQSGSARFEERAGGYVLTLNGVSDLKWHTVADQRVYEVDLGLVKGRPFTIRPAGPLAAVPYKVAHPIYTTLQVEMLMPQSGRVEVDGSDYKVLLGGSQYARASRTSGRTVVVQGELRSLLSEYEPSDLKTVNEDLKRLQDSRLFVTFAPGDTR